MPDLPELFLAHRDKVTDKWSSNIAFYDELFMRLRDRPVRVLEIGVQNGGSLEIWAKYFPHATCFVGCDIDAKCRDLVFADPRISVVVGDANDPDVLRRVMAASAGFDIIIDDGSHRSGDIVRTFATYFGLLSQGGVFVAEDLHCSYWQTYDGGVEHPGSSLSFFRRLTDYVNMEHWGASVPAETMLSYFAERWGTSFDPDDLTQIAEVRFRNSLAVVIKDAPDRVGLGVRVVAGSEALVNDAVLDLDGTHCATVPQAANPHGPRALRREQMSSLLADRERDIARLSVIQDDLRQTNDYVSEHARASEKNFERDRRAHEKTSVDLRGKNRKLVQQAKASQAALVHARSRPLRTLAKFIVFHVLSRLAKASPPLARPRAERIARRAARLNPRRRAKPAKGPGPAALPPSIAVPRPSSEPDPTIDYIASRQEVLSSAFWDERWYLAHHFDDYIAWRAGRKTSSLPIDHYLQVGWRAGYSPSRIFEQCDVGPSGDVNPVSHFLAHIWPGFHFRSNIWHPTRQAIGSYVAQKAARSSRKVVYTCIIDGYDALAQPYHIDPEWDYVCYTDDVRLIEQGEEGVWAIRAALRPDLSAQRRNRYHKTHPHVLFADYDESIYLDGNVNILSSYLFDLVGDGQQPILLPRHFARTCAYEEIAALLVSKRTSVENRATLPLAADFLRATGFPPSYGLTESNVIYRRHHDRTVIRMMKRWWDLMGSFSTRDQATLGYVLWKESIAPQSVCIPNTRTLPLDFWVFRHEKERPAKSPVDLEKKVRPAFASNFVPVVLSCNEAFVAYLGIVLTSLVETANEDRNYDIVVLESDLSDASRATIASLGRKNVSIRFFDMRPVFANVSDLTLHVEGYVPAETYNKIFLAEIMTGYGKVIYIDTDVVIRSDIAELYDIDLFGKALAASPNVANVHAAYLNKQIRGRDFGDYLRQDLGIEQIEQYFQAGVLVLDLQSEKARSLVSRALEKIRKVEQPIFFDQCIFNSIFYGDVHFLSTEWNHVWYLQTYSHLKRTLDDRMFFDYAKSRLNPKIVHYASGNKPTNKFGWRLGSHFWNVSARSVFADAMLQQVEGKGEECVPAPSREALCSEPSPRVLVHFHAFYPEQLDYMFAKLENLVGRQWDLVVTASDNADAIEDAVKLRFMSAEVMRVKNQGFDIYPFLKVMQGKDLSRYDYILKLHTKNGRPDDQISNVYGLPVPGHKWRNDLVGSLLGSVERVTENFERFECNPGLGCLGAAPYIFSIEKNRERTNYRLRHWMNEFRIETGTHYVGGSMFLARAYPFERLKLFNPDVLDFAAGGTASGSSRNLAHVIERLLGLVIETEGLAIEGISMNDEIQTV